MTLTDSDKTPDGDKHVTVVGGGPAGLASVLALLQFGFRVTLLERSRYRTVTVGEHLSPETLPLLVRLGCPPALWQENALACPEIRSSWGHPGIKETESLFNPHGEGLILSRPAFDRQIAALVKSRGGNILTGTRLLSCDRQDGRWQLTYSRSSTPESLSSDFLIDATGRSSTIAKSRSKERLVYDRLIGIVAFLDRAPGDRPPASNSLLIEACAEGWWYSAPLPDARTVATFMTDSDLVSGFKGSPLAFWQNQLARSNHTKCRLKGLRQASTAHIRCARSQILQRISGDAWLAVGDAAMSFDPLSSRGIYKGVSGAIRAARAVQSFHAGDPSALSRYAGEMRKSFETYLDLRSAYYRIERRWPESPFWRRRHDLGSSEAVWLDPEMTIVKNLTTDATRGTESLPPGKLYEVALRLAEEPMPAHRLVSALREYFHGTMSDLDIILALQRLIDSELVINAMFLRRHSSALLRCGIARPAPSLPV